MFPSSATQVQITTMKYQQRVNKISLIWVDHLTMESGPSWPKLVSHLQQREPSGMKVAVRLILYGHGSNTRFQIPFTFRFWSRLFSHILQSFELTLWDMTVHFLFDRKLFCLFDIVSKMHVNDFEKPWNWLHLKFLFTSRFHPTFQPIKFNYAKLRIPIYGPIWPDLTRPSIIKISQFTG